jgi:hypothetical protein
MRIDLLKGKIEDEDRILGCRYEIINDYCCNDMKIALDCGHIKSDGVDMSIPEHEDNSYCNPIIGGLTIYCCPWCGEKIECINPWKPYWTAEKLDELCGGMFIVMGVD